MRRVSLFSTILFCLFLLVGFRTNAGETSVNFTGSGTVMVDDVVMFYDDGGPSGKYTYNTYGSMTFVAPAGKSLRMSFVSFYTYDDDHLLIYDGTSTNGILLSDMAGYYYAEQMADVVSQSQPGALTVYFEPEKNKKYAGWEIRIEAFEATELAVTNVDVTPVNDIKMLRGSTNNRMLRAKVTLSGDQGMVDITGFRFSGLDSDLLAVTGVKVWYTGEDENFGCYDLYGECVAAQEMMIAGSREFDKATEVYFWLTYDIAETADNGAKIQAGGIAVTTGNGEVAADSESTPALTTVQDGMHGLYTVGTSGEYDFGSIGEAVKAMTSGIDGAVTLLLADGNYRELVTVPVITGASETNSITIGSASGNPERVVITFDTYTNPGSSHYDKRYGVFTFDGVNYLTLENVTVTSGTYTSFPGIVYLRNASRHCTVRNCIVSSPTSTDLAYGTSLVYMYTGNVANKNCDYFTLESCTLDGGLIGVTLAGTSSTNYAKQIGGCITGNTFVNQGSKGIYVSYERNARVSNNNIVMGADITTSYYGVDLSAFEGDIEVSGNRIIMDRPRQSAVGMYVRTYSADVSKYGNLHIYNNTFNLLNVSSAVTGIRVNNDIPALELVHNTVNIEPAEGENVKAVGVFYGGSIKGGRMVNNIIRNTTDGYTLQFNREEYVANSGIVMSNNVLYTANSESTVYLGGSGENSGTMDFDKWMTLGYDVDSYNEPVEFESDDCLKPVEKGNLCNGLPVDYVTTDLAGNVRSTDRPTIGAYELGAPSSVVEVANRDGAAIRFDGRTVSVHGVSESCIAEVFTMLGNKIMSIQFRESSAEFAVSHLVRGVYIVKVVDNVNGDVLGTAKIVVR